MSVILESRDQIVRVRLNRPEKLNALTRAMLDELDEVFAGIKQEHGVRAVILTGEGDRAFSAGTDVEELAGSNEEAARLVSERGQRVCDRIESCGVPVIVVVNGWTAD